MTPGKGSFNRLKGSRPTGWGPLLYTMISAAEETWMEGAWNLEILYRHPWLAHAFHSQSRFILFDEYYLCLCLFLLFMEHSKDQYLEVQWVMLIFETDIIEKFNACLGGWGKRGTMGAETASYSPWLCYTVSDYLAVTRGKEQQQCPRLGN